MEWVSLDRFVKSPGLGVIRHKVESGTMDLLRNVSFHRSKEDTLTHGVTGSKASRVYK